MSQIRSFRFAMLALGVLAPLAAKAQSAPTDAQSIAAGKYLTTAGDCIACHTAPGGAPFAGGYVLQTPFGKLLGPNITPDKNTGIGNMSDKDFVNAVKYGHGDKYLYPGMPYVYFNLVPQDEILKIRAYLNTLPPVNNKVVANQLPFPYNIRFSMIGWNMLFFPNHGDFKPDATQSAEWNRGAYLVQGLEHCAACHTPKNALGGDKTGQEFQGAVLQGWNAPNITSAWNGIGGWSEKDIATYLKTGRNEYAAASGPMSEVITNSTSNLTDADIAAIAVYLKSMPGQGGSPPTPLAATDPAMVQGAAVYRDECATCHMANGVGQPGVVPALAKSPVVQAEDPVTLIHILLEGTQGVGTGASPTASAMPAFSGLLNDQQAAAVLTYIRNGWGNSAPAVSADSVTTTRNPQ